MNRAAQLQFNGAGAWRGALNFDAGNVPNEFWEAADHLARLSGSNVTMRAVACEPGPSGSPVATRTQLMHWTRKTGWVKS
ncbi:hypothetical protein ACVC7V_21310 [Hydrogenophaga sp. A37]|uniref:hypothetical protein n=1 Tax=Hydrogenophaga sp. A37 TaxID=1945864 RepID=UPI0009844CF9|nr:hypothetical protein [Hydrogenophaga sp. A37]OOG81545.1 hypothetical protein B0E41_17445 [Hydrogenophaga sp. A37]